MTEGFGGGGGSVDRHHGRLSQGVGTPTKRTTLRQARSSRRGRQSKLQAAVSPRSTPPFGALTWACAAAGSSRPGWARTSRCARRDTPRAGTGARSGPTRCRVGQGGGGGRRRGERRKKQGEVWWEQQAGGPLPSKGLGLMWCNTGTASATNPVHPFRHRSCRVQTGQTAWSQMTRTQRTRKDIQGHSLADAGRGVLEAAIARQQLDLAGGQAGQLHEVQHSDLALVHDVHLSGGRV